MVEGRRNIQEVTMKNLSNIIEFVEIECTQKFVLFRGQNESDLLPRIARNGFPATKILEFEKQIFADFKKKAIPYIDNNLPASDWEWLTLAQHHGLPTRLLDWTRNPLAALWFAIKETKETNTNGIIWVLKHDTTDFVDTLIDESPFSISKTKVYEPSHIARRITAQSACFTAHKYISRDNRFIPINKNIAFRRKLIKLIIPSRKFKLVGGQVLNCQFYIN